MRVHHTAWIYILKSFGPLVNYNKRKLRMAKVVARYINNVGAVLQALLLLGTCIYCIAISGMVNHEDKVTALRTTVLNLMPLYEYLTII